MNIKDKRKETQNMVQVKNKLRQASENVSFSLQYEIDYNLNVQILTGLKLIMKR